MGNYVDYYENGQLKEKGYCQNYDGITITKCYSWIKFSPGGEILSETEYDYDGKVVAE